MCALCYTGCIVHVCLCLCMSVMHFTFHSKEEFNEINLKNTQYLHMIQYPYRSYGTMKHECVFKIQYFLVK